LKDGVIKREAKLKRQIEEKEGGKKKTTKNYKGSF
jgi:hypothetical protein